MEVLARRPSSLLAISLVFFLPISSPCPMEARRALHGEGAAPAARLVDAIRRELLDGGGRRLLQRSAPPPPAPVNAPPIVPALAYSTPPPPM